MSIRSDRVAEITWVPAEKIRAAARLFATTKPAAHPVGGGHRAAGQLRGQRPAAHVSHGAHRATSTSPAARCFSSRPGSATWATSAPTACCPTPSAQSAWAASASGWPDNFAIINPKCVWDAILAEKPYPVKMLFFVSSNPLLTRANAREVYRALEKVEFMAVSDFFITPTAELADIVLPAATWLEMDYIGDFWKRHGYILPAPQGDPGGRVPVGPRDAQRSGPPGGPGRALVGRISSRPSTGSSSPWASPGRTSRRWTTSAGRCGTANTTSKGFSTPTRKFELYSTLLEKLGLRPAAPVPGAAREPRQHAGAATPTSPTS